MFFPSRESTDELEIAVDRSLAELQARIHTIDSLEAKRRLAALVERFSNQDRSFRKNFERCAPRILERIATPSARTRL